MCVVEHLHSWGCYWWDEIDPKAREAPNKFTFLVGSLGLHDSCWLATVLVLILTLALAFVARFPLLYLFIFSFFPRFSSVFPFFHFDVAVMCFFDGASAGVYGGETGGGCRGDEGVGRHWVYIRLFRCVSSVWLSRAAHGCLEGWASFTPPTHLKSVSWHTLPKYTLWTVARNVCLRCACGECAFFLA